MSLFNPFHPPINLLANFDEELQDFYENVLVQLNQKFIFGKKQEKVKSAEKSDFYPSLLKAAYLFRYGPCYTSAVANHLLKMVSSNPLIFSDALWDRCLNICCLGGGPASEVVAISKLLSSAQDMFWISTRKPLCLQVTIIDGDIGWKKTAGKVLKTLMSTSNIFDPSKMDIKFRFVKADLTEPLTPVVRKVLRNADIVMMVKFVSRIKHQLCRSEISCLVKDVAENMQHNAIIFYMDTGVNKQWKWLHNNLEAVQDFKCVYGPEQLEPFMLSVPSIHKSFELYNATIGNICVTSCIINCCAWVKSERLTSFDTNVTYSPLANQMTYQKLRDSDKLWMKQKFESQKVLDDFHQRIHQTLSVKKDQKEVKINNNSMTKKDNKSHHYYYFDYSKIKDKVLFPTKQKSKRIWLWETKRSILS